MYPVNPKAASILGVRCYSSVLEIPDPVDLAMLIVPAASSVETFQQCIRKGVKGAVVISAGFEKTLACLAREHGIPLIGPNCLGVINTDPASPSTQVLAAPCQGRGIKAATQAGFHLWLPSRAVYTMISGR